jgi:glycosyltransferase involved in cell wall biosynthesis
VLAAAKEEEMTGTRPRALYLGKNGYWPNEPNGEYQRIQRYLDIQAIAVGSQGSYAPGSVRIAFPSFRPPLLNGLLYYALAPIFGLVLARLENRETIITKSPFEAALTAACRSVIPKRSRPRLVVEVHGDWRTASRLYGSPSRKLFAPIADVVARWALRRADLIRPVSAHAQALVREAGYLGPVQRLIPFTDYEFFLEEPVVEPPNQERALFVAALERYKAPDVLLRAWANVVSRRPRAQLVLVGAGFLEASLRRQARTLGIDANVSFEGSLGKQGVRDALDACDCLVLPSRAEGLGRVIIEAFARRRTVIAAGVGGIKELISDRQTGLLVSPNDELSLADGLDQLLGDRHQNKRLASAGHEQVHQLHLAESFERSLNSLCHWIGSR